MTESTDYLRKEKVDVDTNQLKRVTGTEIARRDAALVRRGLLLADQQVHLSLEATQRRVIFIGSGSNPDPMGLLSAIETQEIARVVGVAGHRGDALELYKTHKPDAAIIFRSTEANPDTLERLPLYEITAFDAIELEDEFEDWLVSARMIRRFDDQCRLLVALGPESDPQDVYRVAPALSAGALRVAENTKYLVEALKILLGIEPGLRIFRFPKSRSIGKLYASHGDLSLGAMAVPSPDSLIAEARGEVTLPLGRFTRLSVTDVSDLEFIDQLQADDLLDLSIEGAILSKSQIQKLSTLTGLRHLDLESTNISDEDLKAISHLSKLWSLNINSTDVSDEGLGHLLALDRLTFLHLIGTRVTGKGLSTLQKLPFIKGLTIGLDQVSTASLDEFIGIMGADWEYEKMESDRWMGSPSANEGFYYINQPLESWL